MTGPILFLDPSCLLASCASMPAPPWICRWDSAFRPRSFDPFFFLSFLRRKTRPAAHLPPIRHAGAGHTRDSGVWGCPPPTRHYPQATHSGKFRQIQLCAIPAFSSRAQLCALRASASTSTVPSTDPPAWRPRSRRASITRHYPQATHCGRSPRPACPSVSAEFSFAPLRCVHPRSSASICGCIRSGVSSQWTNSPGGPQPPTPPALATSHYPLATCLRQLISQIPE
jgi:hypothetical protein